MAEDLKLARSAAERKFQRAEKAVRELLPLVDLSAELLQTRYDELKKNWRQLQAEHDVYILKGLKDAENTVIAAEDAHIDAAASLFSQCEISVFSKRKVLQNEAVNRNPSVAAIAATVAEPKHPQIKLAPIKFPIFDGNIRTFPKFKYEFDRYLAPMFDAHQLPFILKQYLSESVRRDVDHFDAIDAIWTRLDCKYGSKQKLIDIIMQDITNIPNCDSDDNATLEMISKIENANLDLTKIGEQAELQNSTILSMVEKMMPYKMRSEWAVIAAPLHEPKHKFSELLPFLDRWKERIQYLSSDYRNHSSNHHSSNHSSNFHSSDTHSSDSHSNCHSTNCRTDEHKRHSCWLHKQEEHPIWKCRLFQSLPVQERRALTESHKACNSCLELDHTTNNCTRKFRCPEMNCRESHNQLLH